MGFGGLSPRRRLLAAGVAFAAVAGAISAVVVALTAGGGASSAGGYPAQDRPGPVLLVPGYGGQTGSLRVLAARIRATGRQASVVRLPGAGTGSLITDAGVLNAAADRALRGGAPSVDVIGYSAGGVVALLWARDDGSHKARRVVTLGSPFHGTRLAADAAGVLPGACPAACQQLVPGSPLLVQLDHAAVPSRPRWLSLWTTDDEVVLPADSARLAGAINVPVQSLCPAHEVSHTQLPTDPVVISLVLQAIGPGPISPRAPAGCH